jgi:hypothetical protein
MEDAFMLTYDPEFMEGELAEYADEDGNTFDDLDSLSKADLLQDWIGLLQRKYEEVTGDGFLSDLGATEINGAPPTDTVN